MGTLFVPNQQRIGHDRAGFVNQGRRRSSATRLSSPAWILDSVAAGGEIGTRVPPPIWGVAKLWRKFTESPLYPNAHPSYTVQASVLASFCFDSALHAHSAAQRPGDMVHGLDQALEGRRAVIVPADSHTGAAVAQAFAQRGAQLILGADDVHALDGLVARVRAVHGSDPAACQTLEITPADSSQVAAGLWPQGLSPSPYTA